MVERGWGEVNAEITGFELFYIYKAENCKLLIEPHREKTGLRGFRPGLTQTGLYKLRKELEA